MFLVLQHILGKKLSVALAVKLSMQSPERIIFHLSRSSDRITSVSFLPAEPSRERRSPFQILHTGQRHKTFLRNCNKIPTFSV